MEGIYLIGNTEFGWYKIGQSQDIDKRLESLQGGGGCPFEIGLISAWSCRRKYTRKLEADLHKTFKDFRLRGEWFRFAECDFARIHEAVRVWFESHGLKQGTALIHPYLKAKQESKPLKPVTDPSFTFRFAEEADAPSFSKWVVDNKLIPRKDIISSMKNVNPTVTTLVIEKDGVPVVYAPFHAQLCLDFLGFNPAFEGKTRLLAMGALRNSATAFAKTFGITEIVTRTHEEYPIAQWAAHNGFEQDKRQTYTLRLSNEEVGLSSVTQEPEPKYVQ